MVAEMAQQPGALPLLYEPDRPKPHGRAGQGWRRVRSFEKSRQNLLFREHQADDFGAAIQHAIAMYVLGGGRRSTLARWLGVSETHFQYMLRGAAWGPYGRPVIRALTRLGITIGRGDWTVSGRRSREIIAASRTVMRRAILAIEGTGLAPDERERLLSDLYLLTVEAEREP